MSELVESLLLGVIAGKDFEPLQIFRSRDELLQRGEKEALTFVEGEENLSQIPPWLVCENSENLHRETHLLVHSQFERFQV